MDGRGLGEGKTVQRLRVDDRLAKKRTRRGKSHRARTIDLDFSAARRLRVVFGNRDASSPAHWSVLPRKRRQSRACSPLSFEWRSNAIPFASPPDSTLLDRSLGPEDGRERAARLSVEVRSVFRSLLRVASSLHAHRSNRRGPSVYCHAPRELRRAGCGGAGISS